MPSPGFFFGELHKEYEIRESLGCFLIHKYVLMTNGFQGF